MGLPFEEGCMPGVDKPEDPEAFSQMEEEGPTMVAFSPLQFDVLKRLQQNMKHGVIAHELGISGPELTTQIRRILTSIAAPDRTALLATVDLLTPDNAVTPEAPPHRE
jgi:DNA-binding NarL/FixJ family response regulator